MKSRRINIENDYIIRNIRLFEIISFFMLHLNYLRGTIHSSRNLNNQIIQIKDLKR